VLKCWAARRARLSTPPPALTGTTIRTGRSGYDFPADTLSTGVDRAAWSGIAATPVWDKFSVNSASAITKIRHDLLKCAMARSSPRPSAAPAGQTDAERALLHKFDPISRHIVQ
jgi:hypothetical protein